MTVAERVTTDERESVPTRRITREKIRPGLVVESKHTRQRMTIAGVHRKDRMVRTTVRSIGGTPPKPVMVSFADLQKSWRVADQQNPHPLTQENEMASATAAPKAKTKAQQARAQREANAAAAEAAATAAAETPPETDFLGPAAKAEPSELDAAAALLGSPPEPEAPAASPTRAEIAWGVNDDGQEHTGKERLAQYLIAKVSGEHSAPVDELPFISEDGTAFLHSDWWIAWLDELGVRGGKGALTQPIRDAGGAVKAFPIPGAGHARGLYRFPASKVLAKDELDALPRRAKQRGGGGFKAAEPPSAAAEARANAVCETLAAEFAEIPGKGANHDAEVKYLKNRVAALLRKTG